jgi:hypothetical protein
MYVEIMAVDHLSFKIKKTIWKFPSSVIWRRGTSPVSGMQHARGKVRMPKMSFIAAML